jgi:hypothetical protein
MDLRPEVWAGMDGPNHMPKGFVEGSLDSSHEPLYIKEIRQDRAYRVMVGLFQFTCVTQEFSFFAQVCV